ncbi:hypothetical protein C8J57DRAFT_1505331 [Mycena rebaudengoi]|nr:hypothetical protein C8J57DRAFT_1505331 [Mycena rebaudengoi]
MDVPGLVVAEEVHFFLITLWTLRLFPFLSSPWFLARYEGTRLTNNRMLRGLLSNCHVLSISQLPPTSYTPSSPIVTDASNSSGSAPPRSALALSIQIAAFRWLTYTHDHPPSTTEFPP